MSHERNFKSNCEQLDKFYIVNEVDCQTNTTANTIAGYTRCEKKQDQRLIAYFVSHHCWLLAMTCFFFCFFGYPHHIIFLCELLKSSFYSWCVLISIRQHLKQRCKLNSNLNSFFSNIHKFKQRTNASKLTRMTHVLTLQSGRFFVIYICSFLLLIGNMNLVRIYTHLRGSIFGKTLKHLHVVLQNVFQIHIF